MRPSPYAPFVGNYNGDVPTIPLPHYVENPEPLPDLDSIEARPTLTAYRGYDYRKQGMFLRPHYYFDGATWRDTLTDEVWQSLEAVRLSEVA